MDDLQRVLQKMSKLPDELIVVDYDQVIIGPKINFKGPNLTDNEIALCIDILEDNARKKRFIFDSKKSVKTLTIFDYIETSVKIMELFDYKVEYIDEDRIASNISPKRRYNRTANKLKHLTKQYQKISKAY
jgi:hypothetical protein